MHKLTCGVCGGPLQYGGKGAIPDKHLLCRTLANDVDRVERALKAAWTDDAQAQGVRKTALRSWFVAQLWRMANEITASAIQRKPSPSATARLEKILQSLSRTRAGREALKARGISVE